ncbi:MAG: RIP metalloprotease RseP [Rhodospirillaceae bacterium]
MEFLSLLWTYVLPFLVILTVVVFVHEFGHFWVARRCGVKVEVFSVGFGRELFGRTDRNGTRWRISAIPLGGYVKFFGDADAASATSSGEEMSEEDRRQAFPHKSVAQRAAIVFAGPASNFVFAILVFAGVFMTVGQYQTPAVLGGVQPGSAAEQAGLRQGDLIISMAGKAISRFEDIQSLVPIYGTGPMEVVFLRDGVERTVTAVPQIHEIENIFGKVQKTPLLGVQVDRTAGEIVKYGPVAALGEAVGHTWHVVTGTIAAVGQMITGARGTEDLGGPLGIAQASGQMAQLGFVSVVMFTALLSVNLGLINLFPIPLLDGGHLLFYGVEALRGKPLGERAQEVGLRLGLVFVIGLMIFATFNDIVRFVQG